MSKMAEINPNPNEDECYSAGLHLVLLTKQCPVAVRQQVTSDGGHRLRGHLWRGEAGGRLYLNTMSTKQHHLSAQTIKM